MTDIDYDSTCLKCVFSFLLIFVMNVIYFIKLINCQTLCQKFSTGAWWTQFSLKKYTVPRIMSKEPFNSVVKCFCTRQWFIWHVRGRFTPCLSIEVGCSVMGLSNSSLRLFNYACLALGQCTNIQTYWVVAPGDLFLKFLWPFLKNMKCNKTHPDSSDWLCRSHKMQYHSSYCKS